jgi:hypothetical protein
MMGLQNATIPLAVILFAIAALPIFEDLSSSLPN